MRVVTKRKLSKVKPVSGDSKPFLVLSEDRPPTSRDNPRHVVLVEETNGSTREVAVRNPGDHEVNIGGNTYRHSHEDSDGRWVYVR